MKLCPFCRKMLTASLVDDIVGRRNGALLGSMFRESVPA